ncbi:1-phosphatidylinositol phosphodiesterase [Hydra vulgaris]|uniref:1-phosphatidylinositol phosphodiesterase n=1 Tax=Hydra vulgaris TaxID=6087 RepID=UPI001F5F5F3F|nr:1-phosphatidylinositol phosphodiesterase isoform X1 [Hydra vulgaris]XP_047138379.1 1-phosphatidylinositol phosphodiesterase isoform X1 [Hydra vulgaris]
MGTIILLSLVGYALTFETQNWMSEVDGNKKLSQLAIPGTHDSGAYDTPGDVGEAQDWNIMQQLENGIRFLDIRLSINGVSNDFEIRHGALKLGSFNNLVMNNVNNFLNRNPRETILMSIKNEDNIDKLRLVRDYLRNYNHKFYQNPVTPSTKLDEVRGKVVLFNRYDNDNSMGILWDSIKPNIQDEYNLDTECKPIIGCGPLIGLDYPKKARLVTQNLEIAKQNYGKNIFYINFASANWNGIYIGNSAKVSNEAVKNFFDSNIKVGVIVPMDYPNRQPGLILSMIHDSIYDANIIMSTQNDGIFGTWGEKQMCPPNQYVYAMRLRSEPNQGSGDDTALNAVELFCNNKQGQSYTAISSKQGPYGLWSPNVYCSSFSDPVVGYNLLIEPAQGSGDDTGANNLVLYCNGGTSLTANVYTNYGAWQPVNRCPYGMAVVGLITRVEDNQGDNDDTALNGVRMFCKPF